jgi:integrase
MNDLGHNSEMTARPERVIVLPEANSGLPLKGDFERMARRRYQSPKPKRRGEWWTLRVWKDTFTGGKHRRTRERVRLARAAMSAREVQKVANEYLRPLNQGLETLGSATNFQHYVDATYRPVVMPGMAKSTQSRTNGVLRNYLIQQFDALLELIAEPYATMIYVAVYTGLRVSELCALRWHNVHESSISIEERYCRGEWGAPKSEASNATIAVNGCVVSRIQKLKGLTVEIKAGSGTQRYRVVKSDGSDDLVFQGLRSGKPMRDNNILSRHIKPAGRKLGLDFVNWRCLRTSHATWLKLAGADVKDAQAQMRHSRASTTLDIYQQFVPESQQRVVDKLSGLSRMVQ